MELPGDSPVPIIDSFLQLDEGSDTNGVPMMPLEALRDEESRRVWPSTDMVGYMFKKDPAQEERNHIAGNLTLWLENLERFNIAAGGIPITPDTPNEYFDRLSEHQDRIFCILRADPHTGMRDVRRIDELVRKYPFIRSVSL